ncbi:MAG: F0F1 ATP synthase subunit B' [Campylobacterota bacterium]|nr:F0F1 ATP synthase subunit B' [Campylobacterota bacterium]
MLDIDPVLLLISGITFLLVLMRLNSCLFKPLLKHMDERDDAIKTDLENARNNAADVDGMLADANDVIATAKKEAAIIREKAYSEANEIATSKLNDAKSDIENRYNDFVKSLDEEVIVLKNTLSAQMPQYKDSLKAKLSTI